MHALLHLRPYLRPHWRLIVLGALLAVPLAALRLGPAPIVRYMLDDILVHRERWKLVYFPLALVGLYAVNFVVRFAHYYLLRLVIIRVNQKIKTDLFHHLLHLSADYFTAQSTGTLISRTGHDPQYIDAGLSCINVVIREPITLLFLFIYTLNINWRLTLMTLVVIPLFGWVFARSGRHIKRYIHQTTTLNASLTSLLQESYAGIRLIKLFRLEGYVLGKFAERYRELTRILLKASRLEEASHPLVELITAIALAPIIYYGGLQVIDNQMSPGDLFAFFTAFAMMMNPIRMMNDINIKLNQASAACTRIFEILSWKSTLITEHHPQAMPAFTRGLSLRGVSFAYPDQPDRLILKNVSFELPVGQAIALVGASGAGKTSLVSLIPRIFDVNAGQILIDGADIRQLSLDELRDRIAVVSQDLFLFNDTLEQNIRCGRLDASFAEVRLAAQHAHALDFIESLPQGFQTVIGERGQKLSGGEKQRLSIARAFLRNSPLLILDEATSSLDSQSERAVQAAIEELMVDRTTLIVAHRLSTIQKADQIIVLRAGEIQEKGTHTELMERRGQYWQFYETGLATAEPEVAVSPS